MALTQERAGQLALKVLTEKMKQDGFMLKPKSIKQEITNGAKKLGIPASEAAEFIKMGLEEMYKETCAVLDEFIRKNPS